jgi:hypothetical protein
VTIHGIEVADIRHWWPNDRPVLDGGAVTAVVVHHDGVLMAPGDRNYSGGTLDEDLGRIGAVHRHSVAEGWGAFPYHLMASPNGRLFLCRDLDRRGSHVYWRNHESVGVALMGDFTDGAPGDKQLCAAAAGFVLVLRELGRLVELVGHGEFALPENATACPGETWFSSGGWQHRLRVFAGFHAGR